MLANAWANYRMENHIVVEAMSTCVAKITREALEKLHGGKANTNLQRVLVYQIIIISF